MCIIMYFWQTKMRLIIVDSLFISYHTTLVGCDPLVLAVHTVPAGAGLSLVFTYGLLAGLA